MQMKKALKLKFGWISRAIVNMSMKKVEINCLINMMKLDEC